MGITHESSLRNFHKQIRFVLDGYRPHGRSVSEFSNVVLGGLGGSGIGARIARLAFYTSFPIPVEVFSEYRLPAYAGKETLVILSSYSGNTEETLGMYEHATKLGCSIIVLSSGGKITEMAQRDGWPVYAAETGYQPRMALGYSLSTLLLILGELSGVEMKSSLADVADLLSHTDQLEARATGIFEYFKNTANQKFVVVCDLPFEGAAIRFCQQIQENAKGEAFISVLPEANHNMIESYYGKHETNFILLNSGLNPRVNIRFDYLKSVLTRWDNVVYEFDPGPFDLKAIFEFIHITDWLSILLSDAKGVDNMQVGIISGLKDYLDNH